VIVASDVAAGKVDGQGSFALQNFFHKIFLR